jgi:alpha-amylase/alpha-mannosidase (GH57 family)
MENEDQKRYLIVHGHFYQPPRENPWTERIDRQESAAPYHDWNERITAECYLPNARSRRLDGYGRILTLVNNYEHISFNFGPTLLAWFEKHRPDLLEQIVDADALSAQRRGGHGNAIAQVYNHIIMPLANKRDQETQMRWGVRSFENRFGRMPAGIWLAETAINEVTLELLIDFGFRFIILSPHQAGRIRSLDGGEWLDVSKGNILTGMPYRCFGARRKRSRKRHIDIFFYDAQLSTDVSFNHLCRSGDAFADAVSAAYERTGGDLVTIATDGEIYGHHEPFADMALAYLIEQAAPERGIEITNFPAYLESHEPSWEVQIKRGHKGEGTAWSCPHGVGRWKENCGCSTGAPDDWTQQWRAPLRKGLDKLRDALAELFEKEAAAVFDDPWKARDDFIDVIENRSTDTSKVFWVGRGPKHVRASDLVRGFSLLEAQRNSMLMYTSCGWFFNDISGIETTQLMKYAARAAELGDGGDPAGLESLLLSEIEDTPSNKARHGTGGDLYRQAKKYSAVDLAFLAGQYVLARHLDCPGASPESFGYEFEECEEDEIDFDGESVRCGLILLNSPYTLEWGQFAYSILLGPPAKIVCMLKSVVNPDEYKELRSRLAAMPEGAVRLELLRKTVELFGGHIFVMRDLFPEDKEKILEKISSRQVDSIEERLEQLYLEDRDLLRLFSETSIEAPPVIRVPAETVLSRRLERELARWERTLDPTGLEGVKDILGEADFYGIALDKSEVSRMFTELLVEALSGMREGIDGEVAGSLSNFVNFADEAGIGFEDHSVQNMIFDILTGTLDDAIGRMERLEPESGNEVAGVRRMLGLAKRFNFNVDQYEERIPVR